MTEINDKKCCMCKNDAILIDLKTKEGFCEGCVNINEGIYVSRGEKGKYRRVEIEFKELGD